MATGHYYWASIFHLTIILISTHLIQSQAFDFFYFVQQWPGSYCDGTQSCCVPSTGVPEARFSIHGLWPQNNDGSYPSNCGGEAYDSTLISDLKPQLQQYWVSLNCPSSDGESFWSHEWNKHGTCSGLDQHSYFQAALNLIQNIDILGSLQNAGINANGNTYDISDISNALTNGIGQTPGIQCNQDSSGNKQIYQIYACIDKDASTIIQCPVFPSASCSSTVEFPSFAI